MNKNSNKTSKYKYPSFDVIYKNMCELKEDLYYKDIITAHTDVIEKGTKLKIKEIFWEYKKFHISKHEMFVKIEDLRSGHKVTDIIVKDSLAFARKNFCKVKKSK